MLKVRFEIRVRWLSFALLALPLGAVAHAEKFCSFNLKPVLSPEERLKSAEQYGREKTELLESRLYWSTTLGRKVSKEESDRIKLIRFLKNSVRTERPAIILGEITPAANETVLAYFLIKEKGKLLETIRGKLALDPESPSLLAETDKLIGEMREQGEKFARSYDRYSAAFSYLKAVSTGADESVRAPANTILEYLEPRKIMTTFRNIAGVESGISPTVVELKDIFKNYPEFELYRLRRIRNQEFYATLYAISPTQAVFRKIRDLAKKIPGVDGKSLDDFFDTLLSNEAKNLHGPDIERIGASVGNPADKLEMLRSLNAATDDRLLVTFARYVETRSVWAEMIEEAKNTDKKFYRRMKDAQDTAEKLGDLSAVGPSGGLTLAQRGIDFAFLSGIGYYVYDLKAKKAAADPAGAADDKKTVDAEKPKAESVDQFVRGAQKILKDVKP